MNPGSENSEGDEKKSSRALDGDSLRLPDDPASAFNNPALQHIEWSTLSPELKRCHLEWMGVPPRQVIHHWRSLLEANEPADDYAEACLEEWFAFNDSDDLDDAYDAAASLDLEWSEAFDDWVVSVASLGIAPLIERCVVNGVLLNAQARETRLQVYPLEAIAETEAALRRLPAAIGENALSFIVWWVRIERTSRTGSPDFKADLLQR
jgi:hypothetical protein